MKIKIKVNKDRVIKKTSVSIGDKTFNVSPLGYAEILKLTLGGSRPIVWDKKSFMKAFRFLEHLYKIVINYSDVTAADLEAMTIDEVGFLYLEVMRVGYENSGNSIDPALNGN